MPNVNIHETETIKLVRPYQEKIRRQPIEKIMDMHVVSGKRRRRQPRRRRIYNNREDMNKCELTANMIENRQYWKMIVKTEPQRSGDGL